MYRHFFKRVMDFTLALIALLVLSPVLLVLTVVGAIAMGGNPFFTQLRPGKDEKIFRLIKFRSMNNKRAPNGELLSDEERLVPYGKFLRSTSLDELPSLLNIIKGDLSIVGPRPQLVRDMVFMTADQRRRHTVDYSFLYIVRLPILTITDNADRQQRQKICKEKLGVDEFCIARVAEDR